MSRKKEDVREALCLAKTPQSMEECCRMLRLVPYGQVHKEIEKAVIMVFAYGRGVPINEKGRISSRLPWRPSELNQGFDAEVVDFFLDELKGGTLWFPDFLRSDWKGSHYSKYDFLQYSLPNHRKIIRVAMALLIEHLKMHPVGEELLEDVATYEGFVSTDCEDCGSGDSVEGNLVVYCSTCDTGHHQKCYNIGLLPEPEDEWFCKECTPDSVKKPQTPRPKACDMPRSKKRRRVTAPNHSDKDSDQDYMLCSRESKNPRLSAGPHSERHTLFVFPGRRSQPLSQSQRSLPLVRDPATPAPSSRSSIFDSQPPTESTIIVVNEFACASPMKFLTQAQRERIALVTKLGNSLGSRLLRMNTVTSSASLFEQCRARWNLNDQPGRELRFYAHFDEIGGDLEIVEGIAEDFVEFVKLLRRQLVKGVAVETILVKVALEEEDVASYCGTKSRFQ